MSKMRLLVLVLAIAAAFTIGYGTTAKAWHTSNHGFFTGQVEYGWWDNVIRPWSTCGSDGWAIPGSVGDPSTFINYMACKLWSGTYQDHIGAAFIVSTMTGMYNAWPGTAEWNEFQNRVWYSWNRGWSNYWASDGCSLPNTFYMPSRGDVGYYWGCATGGPDAIAFYNGNGGWYIIKRYCANPVGDMSPAADDQAFNMTGSVTLTNLTNGARGANPYPGDTIQFNHYVRNNGPGSTWPFTTIWSFPEQYSPYYEVVENWSDGGYYGPGEQKHRHQHNRFIPMGTAAGTRYCEQTGVSPVNGYGAVDGRGSSVCAQVVLPPYNLNPSVTVSSTTAQEGDVVQFRYDVHNNSPTPSNNTTCTARDGGGVVVADAGLNCGVFAPSASPVQVGIENVTISGSTAPGTSVCRTLTVAPASPTVGSRTSTPTCVVIGKRPLVRFRGSDVWAGGGFPAVTPACNIGAKITTFGRNLSMPTAPYTAQFFSNNMTASGTPTVTRTDSVINYNWGLAGPAPGVSVNNFSARWTSTQNFPRTGSYTFTAGADDGLRVYVDGNPIIDRWADQSYTTYTVSVNLTAGNHTVEMRYYENGVDAAAYLNIVPAVTDTAGSAVEYNAFALNAITSFGSAGRALVGTGAVGDTPRSMTFGNNESNATLLGYYGAASHCMEDYSSLYGTLPVGGALPITSTTSGAWHSASFPSLSGVAPAGVTKVYYSDGDVTITGNIQYPDTYNNIGDIPSILIIARGNIYVNAGVTRMDGIYVTRGTFFTCYPKVEPGSVSACNNTLTINGAVLANRLDLFRNAGADGSTVVQRQSAAENFNFSPEMYLRNVLTGTDTDRIETTNMIELPPRY